MRQRPWTTALSFLWAFSPLLSLGMLTPLTFLYAAIKRRSPWLGAAAAGYTVAGVVVFVTVDMTGTAGDVAFTIAFVVNMLVGSGHALAIRSRVFEPGTPAHGMDIAIAQAGQAQELRRRARTLAATNPSMAKEIGIGRPDLPRTYDDGGLVDVNHAPPAVLAVLPGMHPALADRLVRLRTEIGPFTSAEEVSAIVGLPPRLTPELADRTVYLP